MATSFLEVTNRATTLLAESVDGVSDPVEFDVSTGEGALFPTGTFHVIIDQEILECTRSSDTFTATRAAEGTVIASHSSGATVSLNATAQLFSDLASAVNTLEDSMESLLTTENHTADDLLTVAESGSIHTNYGADAAKTLTLPASALVGTRFTFIVAAAYELKIAVSAASESFIVNGGTSTDDGGNDMYLSADDEGERAEFVKIATGVWLVTVIGTWSITQP